MAIRYNWLGQSTTQHIATMAAAMSLDDDQFGMDLPPMQIIRSTADAEAYSAEAGRLLAVMQREKQEKEEEEARQKALSDENAAPAQAGSGKAAVVTPAASYPFYALDEDSFSAGYDDSIDPREANGHPPQTGMEPAGGAEWAEMEEQWEVENAWLETEEDEGWGDEMDVDMDTSMTED